MRRQLLICLASSSKANPAKTMTRHQRVIGNEAQARRADEYPYERGMNKYKGTKLRQREKDKHNPNIMNGRYKPKESTRFRLLIGLESLEGQNLKYSRVLSRVNNR